jgi:hypothetical protein
MTRPITFTILLFFANCGFAADVNLLWDPPIGTAPAGYRIYAGSAPGDYKNVTDVGDVTSYVMSGLGTGPHYFAVTAYDISGLESDYSNEVWLTIPDADTTPPVISQVSAIADSSSVTIGWTTDEPATTQVEYGLTASYGSSTRVGPQLLTSHAQLLSRLAPDSTYHYRVRSSDVAGNSSLSPDYTFKTSVMPGTGNAVPPVTPPDADLLTGLAAAYAFDEGQGSTAADSSGAGRNAALNGVSWTSQGKFGSALDFDGTGYAQAEPAGLPGPADPKTLSCWVKLPQPAASLQSILSLGDPATGGKVQLSYRDSAIGISQSGDAWVLGGPAPDTRGWHHLAYVFDGSANSLYVDGAPAGRSTIPHPPSPATAFSMGAAAGGGQFYSGMLDDVRIYNRALSAAEIAALAITPVSAAPTAPADPDPKSGISRPPAGFELKTWYDGPELNARLLDAVTGKLLAEQVSSIPSMDGRVLHAVYSAGEFEVTNLDTREAAVEVKLWLETSEGETTPVLSMGEDGSIVLIPGASISWKVDSTSEGWTIHYRLLDPRTGVEQGTKYE